MKSARVLVFVFVFVYLFLVLREQALTASAINRYKLAMLLCFSLYYKSAFKRGQTCRLVSSIVSSFLAI